VINKKYDPIKPDCYRIFSDSFLPSRRRPRFWVPPSLLHIPFTTNGMHFSSHHPSHRRPRPPPTPAPICSPFCRAMPVHLEEAASPHHRGLTSLPPAPPPPPGRSPRPCKASSTPAGRSSPPPRRASCRRPTPSSVRYVALFCLVPINY
jgi:hypothetical protein